jgi:class 3 adenylate cyclase
MDIAEWLRGLGLEQYTQTFRDNAIESALLPALTDAHLKELGLPLGHRLKLLQAIAALRDAAAPVTPEPVPPTPTPAPSAERRQLTVLFCDLVGWTALSARLDPEDLRAVIGAYHRSVAKYVEGAGGFVAKYMGDGVLAYFGYPRADEHDADRAVRAGLGLVEAVASLDTAARMPLQVRVGIATGLVVVGDLIGEGAAQERAVVGETPNLAARLQALAEPGSVVIAPGTRRLTGGLFDYKDLGPVEIKGLAAPVGRFTSIARERGGEPLRGVARGAHAARRSRRGVGAAAAPLAASDIGRGLDRAGVGRARHRQIAPRRDPGRAARRRAAHPPAPLLLAAPPGPCALPDDNPARTGGRVPARGHRR